MATLEPFVIDDAVDRALREDLGDRGDLTTAAMIPAGRVARAEIVARGDLVLAGIEVARTVFGRLDPQVRFSAHCDDGDVPAVGSRVATIAGSAAAILSGERTALNFLMRMSGIATAARQAVEEVSGTGARILDTRKTAPGLRSLDKYAVAAGGATNHRHGLFDAVMIKDTHLAAVPGIRAAVQAALSMHVPREAITVEVRSLDELDEALDAGAGRALLDNMDLAGLRRAVERASGKIVLEASGGLRPGNLREVAATGVDALSLGWLTHSAPAADLAMEIHEIAIDGDA